MDNITKVEAGHYRTNDGRFAIIAEIPGTFEYRLGNRWNVRPAAKPYSRNDTVWQDTTLRAAAAWCAR